MLTTKNPVTNFEGARTFLSVAAFLLLFLSGCMPPGPRAFFDGKHHLERGNSAAAIESFTQATSLLPTNALVWHYLGLACQEAGHTAEAENAYRQALSLNRDLTEAHYNLGCLSLDQNRADKVDRAKAEFTSFTLRRPNSVEGLVKLGTVQLRLRDLASAEKAFLDALRLSSGNVEALNGLGVVRVQRGRPTEAAQNFAAALKQEPRYAPALFNMAVIDHQYLRNRPAALNGFKQYVALKPAPANVDAVSPIVRQLEQELAPTTAASPATGAPASKSASAQTTTTSTLTLASKQTSTQASTTTAVSSAPKPSSLNPQPSNVAAAPATIPTNTRPLSPIAARNPSPGAPTSSGLSTLTPTAELAKPKDLGKTSTAPSSTPTEMVKLSPEPAIKTADDASATTVRQTDLAADTEIAGPRYKYASQARPAVGNRATAEQAFAQGLKAQAQHRLQEAQAAYLKAVQLDPAFFKAHYNLALVDTDLSETGAAMREYETALAIQPDSLDARYNFALLLKQAGYLADAVRELEKVAAGPNQARAHLTLGNLYAQQLANPATARFHYSKVLEIDPHHPQAPAIRYWLAANPK